MTVKNRVKSALRLPDRGRVIKHKGYARPYRRAINGKLYLYYRNMSTRQGAEESGSRRFKDFIVAPYWKGPRGRRKKLWGVYVEADELVAFLRRLR